MGQKWCQYVVPHAQPFGSRLAGQVGVLAHLSTCAGRVALCSPTGALAPTTPCLFRGMLQWCAGAMPFCPLATVGSQWGRMAAHVHTANVGPAPSFGGSGQLNPSRAVAVAMGRGAEPRPPTARKRPPSMRTRCGHWERHPRGAGTASHSRVPTPLGTYFPRYPVPLSAYLPRYLPYWVDYLGR